MKALFLVSLPYLFLPPAEASFYAPKRTPASATCSARRDLSLEESGDFYLFNAELSRLGPAYGKPGFEDKLEEIVRAHYPSPWKAGGVSSLYLQRLESLVTEARLRNAVAATIGLDGAPWQNFEWHINDITLHQNIGVNLAEPFEKATQSLMTALLDKRAGGNDALRGEAVLRLTDVFASLQRWRVINGELVDERAEASSRSMALFALGAVGASVVVGTTVFSGPIVAAGGTLAASLSTDAATAALLTKLGQIAAGALIGMTGSPAAGALGKDYETYTNAAKESANGNTSFACELAVSMDQWQKTAGKELLSDTIIGGAMGAGGGLITLHRVGAQVLLFTAGAAVGAAQAITVGKMSVKGIEAVSYYRQAERAEASGDHDGATHLLEVARDTAQEAGNQALQAIIVATLTQHIAENFLEAMRSGDAAIRELWAASADTVPSAGKAVLEMIPGQKKK